MRARDRFENFGIGELPALIGRIPGAARQGLVDVTEAVEQFKELRDRGLPPFREVI